MKRTTASAEPKSLVLNRINMVNKLGAKDYYTNDTNALIKIEDHWRDRPSRDHQGLRLYLLLTCFDLLGKRPGKWDDIYTGLVEKLEIDPNIVKTRKSDTFPADYTYGYQSINDVYALRNSFYYFINKILSPSLRKELLDSIIVKKIGKYTSIIEDYNATESEKLKFLFDIRHCYTYKGTELGCGSRIAGIDTFSGDIDIEEDKIYYFSVQWNPDLIIKILEKVISKGQA